MLPGKSEVDTQIGYCDAQYNLNYKTQSIADLYARMASIEATGWIQVTMDNLVKVCPQYVSMSDKSGVDNAIKYNSNFSYDSFRKMLIQVIGNKGIELVEDEVGVLDVSRIKSALGIMEAFRNDVSHLNSHNAQYSLASQTQQFCSPKKTKTNLDGVHDVLTKYETTLLTIKIELT